MVNCQSEITCLSRWAPGIQDMVLALGHPSTFNATGTVSSEKVKFKIQCCRICFITETKHQLSYLSQLSVTDRAMPQPVLLAFSRPVWWNHCPAAAAAAHWNFGVTAEFVFAQKTVLWNQGLRGSLGRWTSVQIRKASKKNTKQPYVGFNAFMK